MKLSESQTSLNFYRKQLNKMNPIIGEPVLKLFTVKLGITIIIISMSEHLIYT